MTPNFAERIKALDPERFHFALGVYCAAAALKGPAPNPQEFGLNIVNDDGSAASITFTDRPENRGMLAVKKEFPDPDEFESMAFRLMTFGEVIRDRKLRKWGLVRDGETGQTEVHDAVINALAMAPFRKSGSLDRDAFLSLVRVGRGKIEKNDSADS